MIKTLIIVNRASEKLVKTLMEIGAIYTDETGIHASEIGVYPKNKQDKERK